MPGQNGAMNTNLNDRLDNLATTLARDIHGPGWVAAIAHARQISDPDSRLENLGWVLEGLLYPTGFMVRLGLDRLVSELLAEVRQEGRSTTPLPAITQQPAPSAYEVVLRTASRAPFTYQVGTFLPPPLGERKALVLVSARHRHLHPEEPVYDVPIIRELGPADAADVWDRMEW
jgi:hypothetical protein